MSTSITLIPLALALVFIRLPWFLEDVGQAEDERRARELVKQLAGLSPNFSAADFLDRPAVTELILLDKGAVVPLQEAIRNSADWSTRASAAYLLTQIGDTSGFFKFWRAEDHPVVRVFLLPGTKGKVEDPAGLSDELNKMPGLDTGARERLLTLSQTPVPLSEAQWRLRAENFLAVVDSRNGGGQPLRSNSEAGRIVTIMTRYGPTVVAHLIEWYYRAKSEGGRWNSLTALRTILGEVDRGNADSMRMLGPHLKDLLAVLENASASPTEMKYNTLDYALSLALILEVAAEDPTPALAVLRRFRDSDPKDGIRTQASYLLKLWDERKKKAVGPSNSDPKARGSKDNGVGNEREPANPGDGRDSQNHTQPVLGRAGQLFAAAFVIALLLVILIRLRSRARRF